MSGETFEHDFMLEDLRVLAVRVESGHPPEENVPVMWSATFYEPDESLGDGDPRVLIGTLHAHASDGWGTVSVGGLITPIGKEPKGKKKLGAVIADSHALESLYDLARITFRTAAATADIHVDLPYKSPDPTVSFGDDLVVTKRTSSSPD